MRDKTIFKRIKEIELHKQLKTLCMQQGQAKVDKRFKRDLIGDNKYNCKEIKETKTKIDKLAKEN